MPGQAGRRKRRTGFAPSTWRGNWPSQTVWERKPLLYRISLHSSSKRCYLFLGVIYTLLLSYLYFMFNKIGAFGRKVGQQNKQCEESGNCLDPTLHRKQLLTFRCRFFQCFRLFFCVRAHVEFCCSHLVCDLDLVTSLNFTSSSEKLLWNSTNSQSCNQSYMRWGTCSVLYGPCQSKHSVNISFLLLLCLPLSSSFFCLHRCDDKAFLRLLALCLIELRGGGER